MGIENIKLTTKDEEQVEKEGIENRSKVIKITDEDRKKAQEELARLELEGKNPKFYDDFSAKSSNNEQLKEEKGDAEEDISRRDALKIFGKTAGAVAVTALFGRFFKSLDKQETKKTEDKLVESQEEIDLKKQEESQEEKEVKIENLADHYLKAYYELSKDSEKFPGDVFETDLLLAQQCQESRGQINAKSHSGALGVMQNMTVSMQDVTRYLNILSRKEGFEWAGPKELSKDQIREIKNLLVKKSDYSRAFGKIYLMQLWDNKNGYSAGRKYYDKGDIKSTQIELMGAYNAGHSRIKDKTLDEWERLRDKYKEVHTKSAQRKYRAYKEVIDYVNKIMNYKERISNIREMTEEMKLELDGKENFLVREIALKLDEISGVSGEARQKKVETEIRKYLSEVERINKKEGRSPSYEEIKKFV